MDNSLGRVFTRKQYKCPACKGPISEQFLVENPFPEVACPLCEAVIRVPKIEQNAVKAPNERRAERCQAALEVKYNDPRQFKADYTKNVCKGGMFIKTVVPFTVGQKIEVDLVVPGLKEPLRILGEVVHKRLYTDKPSDNGIGLKFIEIDAHSREALVKYLKEHTECS